MHPAEQALPLLVPTALGVGALDVPGHRHGTAAEDNADGEDDEAIAQISGVDGQGQAAVGEAGGGPTQQESKTGAEREGAIPALRVAVRAVELAEALADGVEGLAQSNGQAKDDPVEQGGLRPDDGEAD